MENCLLVIFDKIPCTMVQGVLSNFEATLKIHKKSNFDLESAQIFYATQEHVYASEKIIKMEISLLAIFDKIPCTVFFVKF